jgi:hypothetical protein
MLGISLVAEQLFFFCLRDRIRKVLYKTSEKLPTTGTQGLFLQETEEETNVKLTPPNGSLSLKMKCSLRANLLRRGASRH